MKRRIAALLALCVMVTEKTNMSVTTAEIRIPAEMKPYVEAGSGEKEKVRNALMLYPYIADETISHGRAAEILGISKWELIELYNQVGLSYLDLSPTNLEAEVDAYKKVKGDGCCLRYNSCHHPFED